MDQIRAFSFQGEIEASKSLFNRYLIAQSFFPDLQISGLSRCDDVSKMKAAIQALTLDPFQVYDCGAAGTVLRFLMARLSRIPGVFELTGEERLFQRPHRPLIDLLHRLGVDGQFTDRDWLRLSGQGWNPIDELNVEMQVSSQYPSAILLSAWQLPFDLNLKLSAQQRSQSYLKMTIAVLKDLGMEIFEDSHLVTVPSNQTLSKKHVAVEPDMSSAFVVASFATLCGEASISYFPSSSLQPDFSFIEILKSLNGFIEQKSGCLKIKKAESLKAAEFDLSDSPDLFPVLSLVLARAHGVSKITGIDHLIHKESNRIENTIDLLSRLGHSCQYENHSFYIQGAPNKDYSGFSFKFDPDQDHRMAMAAALARQQGAHIDILNPNVVDKSFPQFWKIVGES
ncbi:MAG: 3-phosphoshikimate 1-carboxyvinyltransferase [Bdellovibrionales bacterium]|nr:3-phosphoshikimate 1-carboxyvinyltransferase [Bdellovibrionales bacterium]